MKIRITKGTGTGPTQLSAFDQALVKAGIANFNLIYLSSVIPVGSDVVASHRPVKPDGSWGDRLYVVIAQKRVSVRNKEAWAGIGWMQDPITKQGLLVEHEGYSEAEVRADIENSLQGLAENRSTEFGPIEMEVVGIHCGGEPVCALVTAVFQTTGWREARPANTQTSENVRLLRRLTNFARRRGR